MINTDRQRRESREFYREALTLLNQSGIPYMLGGAFSVHHHTGIYRDTKDLDIFCKSTEYPKILKLFGDLGYKTELTDVRWLAKIFKGEYYIDLIFDTVNGICRVQDSWYFVAPEAEFAGCKVRVLAAEELIFCKIYVQNRERFDGADVNHVLLKCGPSLDWKRLLQLLDPHWHLLLAQILIFQFVYPSEYRNTVPKWVFDELMRRAEEQYTLPAPLERICRGPIIDQTQYGVDVKLWNYKTVTMKTV